MSCFFDFHSNFKIHSYKLHIKCFNYKNHHGLNIIHLNNNDNIVVLVLLQSDLIRFLDKMKLMNNGMLLWKTIL